MRRGDTTIRVSVLAILLLQLSVCAIAEDPAPVIAAAAPPSDSMHMHHTPPPPSAAPRVHSAAASDDGMSGGGMDHSGAHSSSSDSDSDSSMHAHSSMDMGTMPMFFQVTHFSGALLFSWTDLSTPRGYALFSLALVLGCIVREWLSVKRMEVESAIHELAALHSSAASAFHSADSLVRLESHRRCCGLLSAPVLSSLLYGVSMLVGYFLMLVVMSYDVVLFTLIVTSSVSAHYYYQHARPAARRATQLRSHARAEFERQHLRTHGQSGERFGGADASASRDVDVGGAAADDEEARDGLTHAAGGAPSIHFSHHAAAMGLSKALGKSPNPNSRSPAAGLLLAEQRDSTSSRQAATASAGKQAAAMHINSTRDCCDA